MRPKKITNKTIGDFITLKQLLQSVPVSDRTIRSYIDKNKLTAYKLDGRLVFNVLDVEAFLKRRRVGGLPTAPILKEPTQARVLNDQQAEQFFSIFATEKKLKFPTIKELLTEE